MGFMEAVTTVFRRYVDFQGRSSRSELWWFILFYFIVTIVLSILEAIAPVLVILTVIFGLGVFLPTLAVEIRRLHDLDKSGWWVLIGFIPIVGWLLLIYWFCLRGTPGDNRFGPDPLGNVAERFA